MAERQWETMPDSGRLMSALTKRSEKSPDYWGEVSIDIKNLQNVKMEGSIATFRLSGWKKRSKSGTVYLSLAVDRRVPEEQAKPKSRQDDDEDVPF